MAASERKFVRIQEKGQVTLPADLRRKYNLKKGDLVSVVPTERGVLIIPVEVSEATQGSPWLKELYEYFAPVREEIRAQGLTEEEVNAEIDRAVAEVRRRHA